MTGQPAATVTPADVERVARRDFPADQVAQVLALLAEYGPEDWHGEPDRVRVACLKLANGDLERLRREVEGAKHDYRDILSPAEYPGYSKRMFHIERLPPGERERIIEADWKQYQDWLLRP